jgi:hypothetical protein
MLHKNNIVSELFSMQNNQNLIFERIPIKISELKKNLLV